MGLGKSGWGMVDGGTRLGAFERACKGGGIKLGG